MNRPFTTALSLMLLASGGCAAPPREQATPQLTITGFIAKSVTEEPYGFVRLGSIDVDNESVKDTLDPLLDVHSTIETREIVKIRAKLGGEYFYKAFFGPTPDTSKTAVGWFKVSSMVFYLYHGWVYLTGLRPTAETIWVDAGAIGSTLLVHIDDSDPINVVHRVYFVDGTSAWATTGSDTLDPWPDPGTYIEVREDLKITKPKRFIDFDPLDPPPPEVLSFYNEITEIVAAGS